MSVCKYGSKRGRREQWKHRQVCLGKIEGTGMKEGMAGRSRWGRKGMGKENKMHVRRVW